MQLMAAKRLAFEVSGASDPDGPTVAAQAAAQVRSIEMLTIRLGTM